MMVLVDTTVWIDFFSAYSYPHVKSLEKLIVNREDICLSGVILTEVLQGIRKDSELAHVYSILAEVVPKVIRDDLGYDKLWSLFMAAYLWVYCCTQDIIMPRYAGHFDSFGAWRENISIVKNILKLKS